MNVSTECLKEPHVTLHTRNIICHIVGAIWSQGWCIFRLNEELKTPKNSKKNHRVVMVAGDSLVLLKLAFWRLCVFFGSRIQAYIVYRSAHLETRNEDKKKHETFVSVTSCEVFCWVFFGGKIWCKFWGERTSRRFRIHGIHHHCVNINPLKTFFNHLPNKPKQKWF